MFAHGNIKVFLSKLIKVIENKRYSNKYSATSDKRQSLL